MATFATGRKRDSSRVQTCSLTIVLAGFLAMLITPAGAAEITLIHMGDVLAISLR